LSDGGLTAGDDAASTAEIMPIRAGADDQRVLTQSNGVIEIRLPSPTDDGEFGEPRVGFWRRHSLFIATVVLPMAVAAGFLLFVFTPRYSSTASFRVHSIEQTGSEFRTAELGLTVPLISEDTYVVNTYLTSRDLVEQLAKNDNLRAVLGRREGDFVFRYPTFWLPDNNEFLYQRFQWMVTAKIDDATGISTIEVNAFRPDDARALAEAMLRYAEALVNRMNERQYQDQIAVADRFVAEAQKTVDAIEAELKAFRDVSSSLNPNLVAQSELTVIQGLSTQLAQVEASIIQELKVAPTSPLLAGLRAQAQSYRDEIERRKLEIAGAGDSEAVKLQTYDLLTLRRDLALQALADAVGQRELARQDAEQHRLYVELIAKPNLARDWPRYPQTTFDLIIVLGICLSMFQVLRKLNDIAAHHLPYDLQ
jgi:capsular polysaccharide transport system permease protein